MAHSQPYTTLVYQHHPSSNLVGSSPIDNGRQYATFQWRGTPPSPLGPTSTSSPLSLRQTTQDYYATQDLSPPVFSSSFVQGQQPPLYSFQLSDNDMDTGPPRELESSIGPHRAFTRRRSARQQRLRGEVGQDDSLSFSTESRYDLRSTRLRQDTQFISLTANSHFADSSDQSREMENYSSSPFSSPSTSSPNPDEPWAPFQSMNTSRNPLRSPALSSVSTISSPPPPEKKVRRKKRVTSTDKMKICQLHKDSPEMRQQDIAESFGVERSTVSKILKEKARWLSIARTESHQVYRLRDTKFPQLEEQMQGWLAECFQAGKPITDAAIREKAKSLVPELVLMGTFKASAGWLDNFKQRNGISRGQWSGTGTRALDQRAAGVLYEVQRQAEEMDTSGTLPEDFPRGFLAEQGVLPPTPEANDSVDGPAAANADVDMNEDPRPENGPAAEPGLITPSSTTASSVSSPAAIQDAVLPQDVAEAPTDMHVEDMAYAGSHTPPERYESTAESYPERYSAPDPAPIIIQPENAPTMEIRDAKQAEELLDSLLVYLENAETLGEPLIIDTERNTLRRIKSLLVDYHETRMVDRSRYAPV